MAYKYKHGVLGGTFDHLHLGHKDLLDAAFRLSEEVAIGLGTEKIYQSKFLANLIDPFPTRETELKTYLQQKKYLSRAIITPLNDIYGPTLETKDLDAIFVTQKTQPNALIINEDRQKKGLMKLEIITIPLRKDESREIITSERIRLGETDRNGHVYMDLFKNKNKLTLPPHLRQELRHPIGRTVTDVQKIKNSLTQGSLLITVGDIVSKSLNEINCVPDIEIIDFRTRRTLYDKKALIDFKGKMYHNPPGTIHKEVVDVFKTAIDELVVKPGKRKIAIDGEEDLLTLPAILLAPLHSIVCYGQFDLNAVIQVEVTEQKKEIIFSLLRQFE